MNQARGCGKADSWANLYFKVADEQISGGCSNRMAQIPGPLQHSASIW